MLQCYHCRATYHQRVYREEPCQQHLEQAASRGSDPGSRLRLARRAHQAVRRLCLRTCSTVPDQAAWRVSGPASACASAAEHVEITMATHQPYWPMAAVVISPLTHAASPTRYPKRKRTAPTSKNVCAIFAVRARETAGTRIPRRIARSEEVALQRCA